MFGNFYNSNKKHTCTEIYLFLKEMKFFLLFLAVKNRIEKDFEKIFDETMQPYLKYFFIALLPKFRTARGNTTEHNW